MTQLHILGFFTIGESDRSDRKKCIFLEYRPRFDCSVRNASRKKLDCVSIEMCYKIGAPNLGQLVAIIPSMRIMWIYRYFATWSFVLCYSYIYGKTFICTVKSYCSTRGGYIFTLFTICGEGVPTFPGLDGGGYLLFQAGGYLPSQVWMGDSYFSRWGYLLRVGIPLG